jgi:hypothetical protein
LTKASKRPAAIYLLLTTHYSLALLRRSFFRFAELNQMAFAFEKLLLYQKAVHLVERLFN